MTDPAGNNIVIEGSVQEAVVIQGQNNKVEYNYYGYPPQNAGIPARRIPFLLPHLVDRIRQVKAMSEVLGERVTPQATPQIFVVFGDDQQAHDMLLARIEKKILPRLVARHGSPAAVVRYDIPWPEDVEDCGQLPAEFQRNLTNVVWDTESIAGQPARSPEAVNDLFRKCPGPVMLTAQILDCDWNCLGPACVERFLEFWNGWPSLGHGQQLYLFLSVKYIAGGGGGPSGLFQRLLCRWLSPEGNVPRRQIEAVLVEQAQRSWDRLAVHLLPRLDDVDRTEAENWAKSREVKQFGAVSELLVKDIGQFFRQWAAEHHSPLVPMERLADQLKSLLEKDTPFGA